jgi:arylsulfatase A-like enzyme
MRPRDLAHLVALYDGEIAWTDHWLGELDRALVDRGLDRSTLLIVTADHGEEFFEHGRLAHRKNLFDTTLRVPLIIRLPDRRFAGARVSTPVSLVDLAPTIARAAAVAPPHDGLGRNLLRTRLGRWLTARETDLFASLRVRDRHEVALVRGAWKAIAELDEKGEFDPAKLFLNQRRQDPAELRNAAISDPLFTARFADALQRAAERFASVRATHAPGSPESTPDDEKQLRALGYL